MPPLYEYVALFSYGNDSSLASRYHIPTTSTLILAKCVGLGVGVVLTRLWTNSYGTTEDRFWPFILNLISGGRWAPVKTEKEKKVADCNITAETGYVHPAVRRISGCHSNDVENTAGLVLLGFFYVIAAKPNAAEANRIFWTLVAARYGHAVAYVAGVQPFRAVAFLTGAFTGLELAIRTLSNLL
ncbi:Microsomal glutathione S-transferase 1 [Phlyctochytrium planicorne]|nr:Microsomal glutathione S-transferase 1 [Phlyctochytrium planicorne]